ncbi:MAG TPA: glycosyltransferase family 39 protein [Solirubrobacteraceae bacterium]|nr:glycosyltransferase family 39 protein [Solirubrobacteraceae bacterium]
MLLGTLAACAAAAALAVRALAPAAGGAVRVLALAVAGSAALVAAVVLPGALGLLRPGWMAACAAALALAVAAATRGRRAAPPDTGRRWARPRARPWLLAAPAGLLLAACAIALVRDVAGAPVSSIDALNFQLPIPARWIQRGDVWGLHQFIADYSNATYPHNGNALIAAVMLPFDSPFLARLVAVPLWALAGVAVYAIARELGAAAPPAALAGVTFCALPVAARAGLEGAQTDMPMLAWLGAGVLFLLRHHRRRSGGDLVLSGLGLGLALGTKWYALPAVAVVLVLWAAGRRRDLVRPGLRLLALIALAGGFWLVRNWVRTGNPLFPQPFGPFGAPPDPLRDLGGFTIAHYAGDATVWREYLWPALRAAFGLGGVALVAAAAAAAVAGRRDRRVLLVAAAALLLAAAYAVTPYSAFGPEGRPVLAGASTRYGLPALMACAVLAARVRWAQPLLALGVLDGLLGAFDLPAGKVLLGLVLALAALAAARALAHRPRPAAAAVVAGLVLVVAVSAQRANRHGYAPLDPVLAHVEREAPAGRTIGLAGVWSPEGVSPVLPAFGPRLGNEVAYVGAFRDGMLRGPADAAAFARLARRFDLLIVGRGAPPREDVRELDWARRAGFEVVTASPRLVLMTRRVGAP